MEVFMKKGIALFVSAAMLAALSGCSSTTDSTSTTAAVNTSTEENSTSVDTSTSADDTKVYKIGINQLITHDALDAATQGFEDALTDKLGDRVEFDLQNAAGDSATCSVIANQFVASNYDLILANATTALQACASATDSIPILGTSVTDYGTALDISDWTGTTGMNISGTSDLAPLDKQAKMIQELFPDAENIGILYCSGEPNSKYQAETIITYLEDMGYTCNTFTFADSNDVALVTQNACDASDVIYIPTDNTAASCVEAINNVAEPAGIPIVAGEEGICSGCGVATLSISYYDLGYATGEMAYEILVNGADISTMPVEFSPSTTYMYVPERAEALGVTIPDTYTAITTEE